MKRAIIFLCALTLVLLTACGNASPKLPENPLIFNLQNYVNPQDPEDGYLALEYAGRLYLPYGTQGQGFRKSDLGACLGYPVQEGQAQQDVLVCLLADDPACNFLAELFPEAVMQQPVFYRALDTADRSVEVPSFIQTLHYAIWE